MGTLQTGHGIIVHGYARKSQTEWAGCSIRPNMNCSISAKVENWNDSEESYWTDRARRPNRLTDVIKRGGHIQLGKVSSIGLFHGEVHPSVRF